MFQGEVHILARPEIKSLADLAGKTVNFNTVGSAANYTGGIVFDRLGIKAERLFLNNSIAFEKMRTGEIAALVHVVGKPNDLFVKMKPEPGFHFLPLEFTSKFEDYYVPAELTSADYPGLIPQGQAIETISVPALLAVYNWNKDTHVDRYRRCVRFVEYLFDRFDKLRAPPYQPGWKQMNLAGTVPGWTRFPPAQEQCSTRSRPSPPASIRRWRGRKPPVRRPRARPSRSGCSSSSWSGARTGKVVTAHGVGDDASRKVASAAEATGEVRAAVRTSARCDNPAATPHAEAVGKGCVRPPSKVLTGIWPLRLTLCACAAIVSLSRRGGEPRHRPSSASSSVSLRRRRPSLPPGHVWRSRSDRARPSRPTASSAFAACRPTVALTEGHVVAPGSWAIPLAALPNLTIILPIGLQGQSDIAISLVSVDGTVLAEARTVLRCRRCRRRPARRPRGAVASVRGTAWFATLAPAERERALGLHAKGQEQLERGSIYAARKFFERAADIGLAQSAVALADTYDPDELTKLRVIGIQADVEAAKKWYEKARELGAAEASDRLRRLGQR